MAALTTSHSNDELWKKYQAGVKGKDLPAIAILDDTVTQQIVDSGTVLPAQSCIDASHEDMSDFLPTAKSYYTINGALRYDHAESRYGSSCIGPDLYVPRDATQPDGQKEPLPYLLQGFAETMTNVILGGSFVVLTWILVAVGVRRMPSERP